MRNIKLDYSNVEPQNRWLVEEILKYPVYFLSQHSDGRVGILGEDGTPLDDETGKRLTKALYKRYFDKWFLYIGKRRTISKYKIGISRNPEKRAQHLGIELVRVIPCTNRQYAIASEMALHTLLLRHNKQIKGEWFTLNEAEAKIIVDRLLDEEDVLSFCFEEVDDLLGFDAFKDVNFPTTRRKYMKLLHRKE